MQEILAICGGVNATMLSNSQKLCKMCQTRALPCLELALTHFSGHNVKFPWSHNSGWTPYSDPWKLMAFLC